MSTYVKVPYAAKVVFLLDIISRTARVHRARARRLVCMQSRFTGIITKLLGPLGSLRLLIYSVKRDQPCDDFIASINF